MGLFDFSNQVKNPTDQLAEANYKDYTGTGMADQSSKFGGYAPTSLDANQFNQDRGIQSGLATQLQAQAAGGGPSLAQGQLTAATQQGLAGQLAAAAAQQGNQNPGQMARNLSASSAAAAQNLGAQSAQLRSQEQMGAQGQLAGLTGQMAGQDLNLAGQNANIANQAGQFNSTSQQNLAGYLQNQNQFQNKMDFASQEERNNAGLHSEDSFTKGQVDAQNSANTMGGGVIGSVINAGGSLMRMATGGIVDRPTLLGSSRGPVLTGEAGPEAVIPMGDQAAVVPVTPHGMPDGTRALDPNIRALLRHPDFVEAVRMATGHPEPLEQALRNRMGR